MTLPLLRLFTALASALVAAACLVALEFIIAATSGNFLDLLWHSAWFIVGISTFAGVVRLLFSEAALSFLRRAVLWLPLLDSSFVCLSQSAASNSLRHP